MKIILWAKSTDLGFLASKANTSAACFIHSTPLIPSEPKSSFKTNQWPTHSCIPRCGTFQDAPEKWQPLSTSNAHVWSTKRTLLYYVVLFCTTLPCTALSSSRSRENWYREWTLIASQIDWHFSCEKCHYFVSYYCNEKQFLVWFLLDYCISSYFFKKISFHLKARKMTFKANVP